MSEAFQVTLFLAHALKLCSFHNPTRQRGNVNIEISSLTRRVRKILVRQPKTQLQDSCFGLLLTPEWRRPAGNDFSCLFPTRSAQAGSDRSWQADDACPLLLKIGFPKFRTTLAGTHSDRISVARVSPVVGPCVIRVPSFSMGLFFVSTTSLPRSFRCRAFSTPFQSPSRIGSPDRGKAGTPNERWCRSTPSISIASP